MINNKTILYIGESKEHTNSYYRLKALERLGYNIILIDPFQYLDGSFSFLLNKIHYRTGYYFIQKKILKRLKLELECIESFDLIWVNSGELLGPSIIKFLKTSGKKILLYNNDDPTGKRDGRRFNSLIKAIPYYDLCVVMRDVNIDEYKNLGVKKVIRVLMSYDEIMHKAFPDNSNIEVKFKSDVVFIGTWMFKEKRDLFILELINKGINVSIWGDRWEKSPYWNLLKKHHKGKALKGSDYVSAIQGAKLCLCLLAKQNRDLYTRRSLEIPYAGGILCAERTEEHLKLYKEGEEAVFWSDVFECANVCKNILNNIELAESIRFNGMNKVKELHAGNEDICKYILKNI